MENVITLIGPPGNAEALQVERILTAIKDAGGKPGDPVWLDPDHVVDIPFTGIVTARGESIARALVKAGPVDVIAQSAEDRRKAVLVADMDATMIQGETLDELAALAGIGEKVSAITARAMNGEIDFAAALRERVGLLAGQPANLLEKVVPKMKLTSGAKTLVHTMKANGARTILVSGGFKFFTTIVAGACGFDEAKANDLEIAADGTLTGRVVEPIRGRVAKREALMSAATRRRVPLDKTLAIGDGANDLEMLLTAGLGIAFHAKPTVAAQAKHRIDHGDLTAILYAQGYKREEFVG
ncbi:MAG TPA: phosphoserine phosphatase SerB [Magnetospirillaceae bacterium]|jgi:phosphoserine phosphatase